MSHSRLEELKTRAKLLLKSKQKSGIEFTLRQALDQIAATAGHPSWRQLQAALSGDELYYPSYASARLNAWFAAHADAAAYQAQHGGHVLPYRGQFFVCETSYVEMLGIPAHDPDLALVGPDWTQPRDAEAWGRLHAKLLAAQSQRP